MIDAKKSLGQHFLIRPEGLDALMGALDVRAHETVIEIGPGRGALTQRLMQKIEAVGGKGIVLIEKDDALYVELNGQLKAKSYNLKAILGDALKLLPNIVAELNDAPYIIAGNIPYYITGHLLRTIGELEHKPRIAALMVQKEVAERIVAMPPHANRLSISVQLWAKPKLVLTIPPSHFDPPPTVDSAIIALETDQNAPQGEALMRAFHMMHAAFQQPRKTIANNLADGLGIPRAEIETKLAPLDIDPTARPSTLDTEAIEKLAKVFFKPTSPERNKML